jgi:hypothetical protein
MSPAHYAGFALSHRLHDWLLTKPDISFAIKADIFTCYRLKAGRPTRQYPSEDQLSGSRRPASNMPGSLLEIPVEARHAVFCGEIT